MKIITISLFALTLSLSLFSFKTDNDYKPQDKTLKESMKRGQQIYDELCTACHMTKGEGVEDTYPPLAKSDYLMKNRKESISIIKFGKEGEIKVNGKTYDNYMASLGLTDQEIADVMNYITNSWGNKNPKMVTKSEVSKIKK